ncbi:hypothetical protein BB560_001460 [Smittium megazygosporum]|uniref:Mediator of RNA polymerase II transcription subunit 31 n=1 Tax=Smittium megazygosporum TaxID=133381 RepID=A0A2T9ZHG3_9FUNG|nr:hypothetical protein BB560_001460 [Smittium megazygosporum]
MDPGDTPLESKEILLDSNQPAMLQPIPDDSEKTRFLVELEFVQYLAQQGYFEKEEFINYLQYLTYFKEPKYAKYIIDAMKTTDETTFIHSKQYHFWQNRTNSHNDSSPEQNPDSAPKSEN